jgi:hypothetical protein
LGGIRGEIAKYEALASHPGVPGMLKRFLEFKADVKEASMKGFVAEVMPFTVLASFCWRAVPQGSK